MENTTIAMESLDSLARIFGHCGIYEKLYGQKALDASQSLNDSLVDLYVLILEYLCYLKRHLSHNTAGNYFISIAMLHDTPDTLDPHDACFVVLLMCKESC